MDNQTRKLQATADTAEAEGSKAATGLGKFKDVKTLMEAYEALEAEFTRRSQRLRELEAAKKAEEATAAQAANAEQPSTDKAEQPETDGAKSISEEVKNAVIEEYLAALRANKGVPFVTGGGSVAAQRRTPKTLKEAGDLAKNYFDNKENED